MPITAGQARAAPGPKPAEPGGYFPYGAPTTVKADPKAAGTSMNRFTAVKFNPAKAANPFQTDLRKCKSQFSQSYASGSIPCRLQSTTSKYHLQWEPYAATGFSPELLIVCADGLQETEHPYTLMAPMMFEELVLRAEGSAELFAPVMDPVVGNLRKCLMLDHAYAAALKALTLLAEHTGTLMMPQLQKILPCMAKGMRDKALREATYTLLHTIEQKCGPEATKLIKKKIPTY